MRLRRETGNLRAGAAGRRQVERRRRLRYIGSMAEQPEVRLTAIRRELAAAAVAAAAAGAVPQHGMDAIMEAVSDSLRAPGQDGLAMLSAQLRELGGRIDHGTASAAEIAAHHRIDEQAAEIATLRGEQQELVEAMFAAMDTRLAEIDADTNRLLARYA